MSDPWRSIQKAYCMLFTDTFYRQDDNGTMTFDLACQSTIYGRYMTIQLMGCGILQVSQVQIYPPPGKLERFVRVLKFIATSGTP